MRFFLRHQKFSILFLLNFFHHLIPPNPANPDFADYDGNKGNGRRKMKKERNEIEEMSKLMKKRGEARFIA